MNIVILKYDIWGENMNNHNRVIIDKKFIKKLLNEDIS